MNPLEYSSTPTLRRPLIRKRVWIVIATCVVTTYVVAYIAMLPLRKPAMNLAYFYYSDDGRLDAGLYYLFLPAYKVHRWSGLPNFIPAERGRTFPTAEQVEAAGP